MKRPQHPTGVVGAGSVPLTLAILIVACLAPRADEHGSATVTVKRHARATGTTFVAMSLTAPDTVRRGREAVFRAAARNPTADGIELSIGSGPACDFVVARENGAKIARYPEARLAMAVQARLPPDSSINCEWRWNQRDSAGRSAGIGSYSVTMIFASDLQPTLRSMFRIVP